VEGGRRATPRAELGYSTGKWNRKLTGNDGARRSKAGEGKARGPRADDACRARVLAGFMGTM
jgi:hypothetical protein